MGLLTSKQFLDFEKRDNVNKTDFESNNNKNNNNNLNNKNKKNNYYFHNIGIDTNSLYNDGKRRNDKIESEGKGKSNDNGDENSNKNYNNNKRNNKKNKNNNYYNIFNIKAINNDKNQIKNNEINNNNNNNNSNNKNTNNNDKYNNNEKKKTTDFWSLFCKQTSLHGFRLCLDSNAGVYHVWRRRVVLLILLFNAGFLTWNCISCYASFRQHLATIEAKVHYPQSYLTFPSLTICNQNKFRLSESVETGVYPQVLSYYQANSFDNWNLVSTKNYYKFDKNNNNNNNNNNNTYEDLKELTFRLAHQKHDLIYSCEWSGEKCNIEEDFKVRLLGFFHVCYTFNWKKKSNNNNNNNNNDSDDKIKKVHQPGSRFSLKLTLNLETYDHIRGSGVNAGIKALVHPPGEFPLVEEWGFSVAPGTHTLVGISSTQHHNLPPPYGICSLDGVPRSQCLASAKTSALEAKCNCSNADENEDGRTIDAGVGNGDERKNGMGENGEISDEVVGSKRVCNVSEAFMCAQLEDFVEEEMRLNCWQEKCSSSCSRVTFKEEISCAKLAKIDVLRFKTLNPTSYEYLKSKKARAKRADEIIKQENVDLVRVHSKRLITASRQYKKALENIFVIFCGSVSERNDENGSGNREENDDELDENDDNNGGYDEYKMKNFENQKTNMEKNYPSHNNELKTNTSYLEEYIQKELNGIHIERPSGKNIEHKLVTEEKAIMGDLKVLRDNYVFKDSLVKQPQPSVEQFWKMVKLLCSFLEKPFPFSFMLSQKPQLPLEAFNNQDRKDVKSEFNQNTKSEFKEDNPNVLKIEEIMISYTESLLNYCYFEETQLRKANMTESKKSLDGSTNKWDDYYSCYDQFPSTLLGIRKSQIKTAMRCLPNTMRDLGNMADKRLELSKSIFSNTSYEHFLYAPNQRECMNLLKDTSSYWTKKTTNELEIALKMYLAKDATWEHKLQAFHLIDIFMRESADQETSLFEPDNFEVCDWPVSQEDILTPDKNLAMLEVYLNAASNSFRSINQPSDLEVILTKTNEVLENFQKQMLKILDKINDFLKKKMTQADLLTYILESNEVKKIFESIKSDHHGLLKIIENFILKTSTLSYNVIKCYESVIDLQLPAMDDVNIQKSYIIKMAEKHSKIYFSKEYSDLVMGLLEEDSMQKLQTLISRLKFMKETSSLEVVQLLHQQYIHALQQLHKSYLSEFKGFLKALAIFEKELVKSTQDDELDQGENMIKLDVFYKEISYKTIQQRPAMTGLVLFSRIGSSMSLLLGASILTFCETLDFLIIYVKKNYFEKIF